MSRFAAARSCLTSADGTLTAASRESPPRKNIADPRIESAPLALQPHSFKGLVRELLIYYIPGFSIFQQVFYALRGCGLTKKLQQYDKSKFVHEPTLQFPP